MKNVLKPTVMKSIIKYTLTIATQIKYIGVNQYKKKNQDRMNFAMRA